MILLSFLSAVALSTFDEAFQFKMSNRIFDVSDIAKDSWGAVIGLILVLFVAEPYGRVEVTLRNVWHNKLSDYLRDPLGAMLLVGLFSLTAIMLSPLLTDFAVIQYFLLGLVCIYVVVILLLHHLQTRKFRIVFASIVGLLLLGLGISLVTSSGSQLIRSSYALTIYRGIPIPFFDVLIYPNGLPRLVDKKHFFNNQDKQFLLEQKPDILIIASGHRGKGGKGFAVSEGTYFAFNRYIARGTQLIVLPSTEACKEYDRLKRAGKRIMLVMHSSC